MLADRARRRDQRNVGAPLTDLESKNQRGETVGGKKKSIYIIVGESGDGIAIALGLIEEGVSIYVECRK